MSMRFGLPTLKLTYQALYGKPASGDEDQNLDAGVLGK
jgi:hypothetical protein